jgi:hypothetical protein
MATIGGENTATTLTSNFKEVYADDLKDLRPQKYILQSRIGFKASAKLGKLYHQPVLLAREGGFSYKQSAAAPFTYGAAIPSVIKDAQLQGSQIFGHATIDFEAAAKGESTKNAFKNSVGIVIESLWDASQHRQECDLWYGQNPTAGSSIAGANIGVVSAVSSAVITISDAEWASGIYTACEGNQIQFFKADYTVLRGSGDSAGSYASGVAGTCTITKVDPVNKKLTIDFAPSSTAIIATDVIHWATNHANPIGGPADGGSNSMLGLHGILNTTSGNLLNISTDYSKWAPSQVACNGNLTLKLVQIGVAKAKQKGLDEPVALLISDATWAILCNDWASLVRFDKDTGTYTLGAEALKIRANNIKVDIMTSTYCKEGYAYMIPFSEFTRIGATDLTTEIPGRKGQELFTLVPGTNTYEFQTYQHIALFGMPGKCTIFTGITNI